MSATPFRLIRSDPIEFWHDLRLMYGHYRDDAYTWHPLRRRVVFAWSWALYGAELRYDVRYFEQHGCLPDGSVPE